MGGQLDGVRSGLGAAVDRDLKPSSRCLHEALCRTLPLVDREEDSLARRPEREDALQPSGRGEEVDVRRDGVFVERGAAVAERRDRGGK